MKTTDDSLSLEENVQKENAFPSPREVKRPP